jgi:hypothetical protein
LSPRVVCALKEFGECEKTFYACRPWQKCCCQKHQKRLDYLMVKKSVSRARRRMAKKRTQAASNAPRAHSPRIGRRRQVAVRSMGNVLAVLLAERPEVFRRLAEGK